MSPVRPPREPDPPVWNFSALEPVPGEDLVAVGADLDAGTLLAAYRAGLFPMGVGEGDHAGIGWWSPDPRGVLPYAGLVVHRSLRRARAKFEVSIDRDFSQVIARCATLPREGHWITEDFIAAYEHLHELGWAHSVETWHRGELVGGLYGVAIGGLFAGESMFHTERDASKVALLALTQRWWADEDPRRLIDVQWATPHLRSLGVQECPRAEYSARLEHALTAPTGNFAPV